MRIAIVSDGFLSNNRLRSSTPVLVDNLRHELEKRNNKVLIYTPLGQLVYDEKYKIDINNEGGMLDYFSSIKKISRLKPDIIHVHGDIAITYLVKLWKLRTSIPIVTTITRNAANAGSLSLSPVFSIGPSYDCQKPWFDYLKKKIISSLDHIIVMNQFMKSVVNINEKKISVIKYGIRRDWEIPDKITSNTSNKIFYWGDGSIKRGYHLFLNAAKIVKKVKPEVQFISAIRGLDPTINKHIGSQNTEEYLTNVIYKKLNSEEMIKELLQSKIVVLPFLSNSMEPPLTILESMYLRKPVITTRIGGNTELIKNNVTGLFINSNSKDLAKTILNKIDNNNELEKIGVNAQKFIIENYDWDKCVKEIIKIYEILVRR